MTRRVIFLSGPRHDSHLVERLVAAAATADAATGSGFVVEHKRVPIVGDEVDLRAIDKLVKALEIREAQAPMPIPACADTRQPKPYGREFRKLRERPKRGGRR